MDLLPNVFVPCFCLEMSGLESLDSKSCGLEGSVLVLKNYGLNNPESMKSGLDCPGFYSDLWAGEPNHILKIYGLECPIGL